MPGRYASYNTRQKLERGVQEFQKTKDDPVAYATVTEKEKFEANLEKRKNILDSVTPPTPSKGDMDKLRKRVAQLSEALVKGNSKYVPSMATEYEMQKAPTGAVDKLLRWESFWKNHNIDENGKIYKVEKGGRGAAFEWKDLQRILAKGFEAEAPNAANLAMLRSVTSTSSLAETRLPVSYGFSEVAKQHYEEVFTDHPLTDVEQKVVDSEVERLQLQVKQLEAELAKTAKKRTRDLSNYKGPRCEAMRKDGSPCEQPAVGEVNGKKHCMSKWHKKQVEEIS